MMINQLFSKKHILWKININLKYLNVVKVGAKYVILLACQKIYRKKLPKGQDLFLSSTSQKNGENEDKIEYEDYGTMNYKNSSKINGQRNKLK